MPASFSRSRASTTSETTKPFVHRIEDFLRAGLHAHPDFGASRALQGIARSASVIRSARD